MPKRSRDREAALDLGRGPGMIPHLIGIAGPSCAGKSELARWLAARLNAPVLNLDHYYVDLPIAGTEPIDALGERVLVLVQAHS